MSTWGDVQTLVIYNLGRQSDPNIVTLLPIWADLFQQRVQSDRRYWFLKTTATRNIDQNAQSYPLPSDYRHGMVFYLLKQTPTFTSEEFVELDQFSDLDVIRMFGPALDANNNPLPQFQAEPIGVVIGDVTVTFWPWPKQQYLVKVMYWRDMAPPVVGSPNSFVNKWITDYASLYEAELTAAGYRYLGMDVKAVKWEALAKQRLDDVRAANVIRELAGPGKLVLTPMQGVYGSTMSAKCDSWRIFDQPYA